MTKKSACISHTHNRDILRLWRLAGERTRASKDRVANTTQRHSLWSDMPTQPGQVHATLVASSH